MQITEVKVMVKSEPKLKGFANVTFDNEFVVRGIKIIEGQKGLFISMPSKRGKDGKFRDIAHPINNEAREKIQKAILEEYNNIIAKKNSENSKQEGT
jgi:stage V sporulation protein G|uniref:Putative septation protein SpoVG n=1 Tax=candidate division WOR-3 bacterium TaxID=2052148 RepID=A0A7C4YBY2_UNCW3